MMMQLGFFLVILPQLYAALTGLATCNSLNTNRASCQATGHCTWKSDTSTCVDSECQKITEVAVCRTGLAGSNIDFTSRCKINQNYNFNYQNVCLYNSESSLRNGFLRSFKWTNITSTPTSTLSNIPATTLIATTEPQKYTYQLFTLDILLATNSELQDILDGYLHAKNQIITDVVQPKFLEKAIFECLQNIRDDIALVDADRQTTLTKIWTLIDNLYMRYYLYKSQLIQPYNLVTFSAANLNRLSIAVPGVQNKITVQWDNTYSENGYMQIVSFAPEQFGITGIRSDIIVVTPIKISDFSSFTVPFTLKFEWTDAVADTSLKIYKFDRYTRVGTDTGTTVACTGKVCVLTAPYSTQGDGYFFSVGVPTACGSFSANAMLCRLQACGTCP